MKLTKKTCELVANLEYFIGSECYNPNSYDGWNDLEGCNFRYPINVPIEDYGYDKIRFNINEHCILNGRKINEDAVKYMKYKFGSNELFVGAGLINILEYLEKRYNLDFNELENNVK